MLHTSLAWGQKHLIIFTVNTKDWILYQELFSPVNYLLHILYHKDQLFQEYGKKF